MLFLLLFMQKSVIIFLMTKMTKERSPTMLLNILTAVPNTGNVSVNTYLIIVIAAAGLIAGAVLAGVFTKKKK